jgi:hypothetical protein
MTVMEPRKRWTDLRLDDLNKKVDDGFARVEAGLREVKTKFGGLEKKVDEGFGRLDQDMRELRGEMKNLTRGLFAAAVAIVVALIGCIATLVGIAFL